MLSSEDGNREEKGVEMGMEGVENSGGGPRPHIRQRWGKSGMDNKTSGFEVML